MSDGVNASAAVEPTAVRLSDPVRATLAVEGPAPLRIDLPSPLLADFAAPFWLVTPAGPAVVEPLPGGRETWRQTFRLDPLAPGDPVPLAFAPAAVTAGGDTRPTTVQWSVPEVRVHTAVAAPKPEDVRPITGIEELPPPDTPPVGVAGGWLLVGVAVALLAAAGVAVWVRRRKPPPAVPPLEWANGELDRVDGELAAASDGRPAANRVAEVVRGYVARRYGLPVDPLTTAELLAAPGWPADDAVRDLLARCDAARFAGVGFAAADAAGLAAVARAWVTAHAPPP